MANFCGKPLAKERRAVSQPCGRLGRRWRGRAGPGVSWTRGGVSAYSRSFTASPPPYQRSTPGPSSIRSVKSLAGARIFKLLRSPRIDSKEPIPPGRVALAGRYDNPVPTRFLAPVDCKKNSSTVPVLGLFHRLCFVFISIVKISVELPEQVRYQYLHYCTSQ